jgi:hypothetical protein
MNEQCAVVRGIRGEEIEVGGPFCNWSVAQRNSKQTYFDLVDKPRTSVQGCRGRARVDVLLLVVGRPVLDSAQYYSRVFFFFFLPS